MRMHRLIGLALAALVPLPVFAQQYQITDLGVLHPTAVNNSVQISGTTSVSSNIHAFLYSNGAKQDLGTLGGNESWVFAINNRGEMSGGSWTASNSEHAFIYSNGFMNDLGTLAGSESSMYGINDYGHATGCIWRNSFPYGVVYSYGSLRYLDALGSAFKERSCGEAINASDEVTGLLYAPSGSHAFLLDRSGVMTDLGTLGGTHSDGMAINSRAQVTGISYTSGNAKYHAFIYANGQMTDLGVLGSSTSGFEGSEGWGINSSGQVVGVSATNYGVTVRHAFLYSNGVMTDLNTLIDPANELKPYVVLTHANAISDTGLIVADGVDSRTGQGHGYLLSTSPPVVTPTISGTLGANGWYVSDVIVSWSAVDNESVITSPACAQTVLTADTAGTVVSCSATSSGGTTTKTVTIKIDKSTPTCTAKLSPNTLRNNHALQSVTAVVTPGPAGISGPAANPVLIGLTSSEADQGLGRGDLPGDMANWTGAGGQLRGEAFSTAGRTYTARLRISNPAGRSGACSATAFVPAN